MHTATLSKIVRQKDEDLCRAVEAMASGRIADGVKLLREQNRVQSLEHRGERFRAIAQAFAKARTGPWSIVSVRATHLLTAGHEC